MQRNSGPLLLVVCLSIGGCHSNQISGRLERDCCVVAQAGLVAPAADAESLPAILAAADARSANLARVVSGIDEAIQICDANIAHAETTAYRTRRAKVGSDGVLRSTADREQGSLEDTRRDLDVGIQGKGFFKVKVLDSLGSGFAYTRNGNLFANNKGELVVGVGDGYHLEPPITLPPDATDITIGQSGIVEYKQPHNTDNKQAGQIQLSVFINEEQLSEIGSGLYFESSESGKPVDSNPGESGAGITLQGFLEASNVNLYAERARIRFLQRWRETVLDSIDDRPRH